MKRQSIILVCCAMKVSISAANTNSYTPDEVKQMLSPETYEGLQKIVQTCKDYLVGTT
jgi:hypothetical protein